MPPSEPRSVRTALTAAIADAIKRRDRTALAAYRTALAAIDNAAAVPVAARQRADAIEQSAIGVGRTDASRRDLSEAEMIELVAREVQERHATADSLTGTRPETAQQLRREADLLRALLDELAEK